MTEEQFNNLPVADKLAKLAKNIRQNNNKEIRGIKNITDIFPGINGKSYG